MVFHEFKKGSDLPLAFYGIMNHNYKVVYPAKIKKIEEKNIQWLSLVLICIQKLNIIPEPFGRKRHKNLLEI